MTGPRGLSHALLGGGGAGVVAALGWWSLTFWPPVSNRYLSAAEAGRCLLSDSSLCLLATSLCGARHALWVSVYSPLALWGGLALAFSGLICQPPRRGRMSARDAGANGTGAH